MQVEPPIVLVRVPVEELHTTIPLEARSGAGKVIMVVVLALTLMGGKSKVVSAPSLGTVAELIIIIYSAAVSVTASVTRLPAEAFITWLASSAEEEIGVSGEPEVSMF
jgi:hypothetical protein